MNTLHKPKVVVIDEQRQKLAETKKNNTSGSLLLSGALLGLVGLAAITGERSPAPTPEVEETFHAQVVSADKKNSVGIKRISNTEIEVVLRENNNLIRFTLDEFSVDEKGQLTFNHRGDLYEEASSDLGLCDSVAYIYDIVGYMTSEADKTVDQLIEEDYKREIFVEALADYIRHEVWLPLLEQKLGYGLEEIQRALGAINWAGDFYNSPLERKCKIHLWSSLGKYEVVITKTPGRQVVGLTKDDEILSTVVQHVENMSIEERKDHAMTFISDILYEQLAKKYSPFFHVFMAELDQSLDGVMSRLEGLMSQMDPNLSDWQYELKTPNGYIYVDVDVQAIPNRDMYSVTVKVPAGEEKLLFCKSKTHAYVQHESMNPWIAAALNTPELSTILVNILKALVSLETAERLGPLCSFSIERQVEELEKAALVDPPPTAPSIWGIPGGNKYVN